MAWRLVFISFLPPLISPHLPPSLLLHPPLCSPRVCPFFSRSRGFSDSFPYPASLSCPATSRKWRAEGLGRPRPRFSHLLFSVPFFSLHGSSRPLITDIFANLRPSSVPRFSQSIDVSCLPGERFRKAREEIIKRWKESLCGHKPSMLEVEIRN